MQAPSHTHIITVLLVDDHQIVLEGLTALLEAEKDIHVVGRALDGQQAVSLEAELHPDVVVMDIAMPILNGLEATRHIHRHNPGARVVLLSAHRDDVYIERALALGASGFLIKQSSAHVLADAIRKIHAGGTFYSPGIEQSIRQRRKEDLNRLGTPTRSAASLTPREAETLQMVAEGMANKQMADHLKISIKTVEKHRNNLMRKLGIHDTAGLTRYAIATGVIQSHVPETSN
ncbi:MAG: response regulator transcription factor [Kiritimatiellia bacterium]